MLSDHFYPNGVPLQERQDVSNEEIRAILGADDHGVAFVWEDPENPGEWKTCGSMTHRLAWEVARFRTLQRQGKVAKYGQRVGYEEWSQCQKIGTTKSMNAAKASPTKSKTQDGTFVWTLTACWSVPECPR